MLLFARGTSVTKSTFQKDSVLWITGFLILSVLAVYGQVLGHSFIAYDDPLYITQNEHVVQGLTRDTIRWSLTAVVVSNWHPLTMLSHLLDVELFGANAGLHHFMSVLIHLASTLLAFHVLRRLTGATWRAGLVAALFALHPLHVESVAWASERKDVLSVFFWLLTVLAYKRYTERIGVPSYALVMVCFALGLLAKPMLVTLPVILLALDYWPLNRFNPEDPLRCIRILILEKIPLFVLALGAAAGTILTQTQSGATSNLEQFPFQIRLANAALSSIMYIWKTILPTDLVILYPHQGPATSLLGGVACAILLGIITVIALRLWQSRPYFIVGWTWYVITLSPVIGIIQVGSSARADHYTYIPHIGLFIALAWALGELIQARPELKRPIVALSGAVLIALIPVTFSQVSLWRNDVTLFTKTAQVSPASAKAQFCLGVGYVQQENYSRAAYHFERSLELNPLNLETMKNLGSALLDSGHPDKAEVHYREIIGLVRNDPEHYTNLAAAMYRQANYDEAMFWAEEALRVDEEYPRALLIIQESQRALPPQIPID